MASERPDIRRSNHEGRLPGKTRRSTAALGLGVVWIVLLVQPVSASTQAASISLSRTFGPPTSRTMVRGSGFVGGEEVDVTFDSTLLGRLTADASGSFVN